MGSVARLRTSNRSRMRSFVLLSVSLTAISAAPQGGGLFNTIANALTSVVGGGNTGEVEGGGLFNTGVYISRKKAMSVFATTMGGYPNFANEARKLKDLLERGRASEVDFSEYMSMSYDNPWKILNRRNDVMYKKL